MPRPNARRPTSSCATLIEAEIAARDESNLQARVKVAGFPVRKSLDEFKVQASAVPQASFDYLAGLEWVRAKENLCLVWPAGTGKSHPLVALGYAAIQAVIGSVTSLPPTSSRPSTAASPTTRVGWVIDNVLRSDLVLVDELGFAPLDATGGQLLFRFVAAAYERRSLGIASHWPFNEWGHFLPDQTTAV